VGEGTQYDDVNPPLEVVRNVAELLACIERCMLLVDEHCCTAQARHPRFKSETSAQRWLLEKHHHLLASKRALEDGRARFHERCEVQHTFDSLRTQITGRN